MLIILKRGTTFLGSQTENFLKCDECYKTLHDTALVFHHIKTNQSGRHRLGVKCNLCHEVSSKDADRKWYVNTRYHSKVENEIF